MQVTYKDTCIILDGGSGIQRLGESFATKGTELHIMLTHLHLDHTMGLGFFLPMYNPEINLHIWGPATSADSLTQRLRRYFSPPLFPVRMSELPKHPLIHEISDESVQIGDIKVTSSYVIHPGPTVGYRLEAGGKSLTYIPDHEIRLGSIDFPNQPKWTSGYDLAKGVDLLMHDGQYQVEEYRTRVGWGHSSMQDAIDFAKMCEVKKLLLFHHDPMHTDEKLEALYQHVMARTSVNIPVELCREGMEYEV